MRKLFLLLSACMTFLFCEAQTMQGTIKAGSSAHTIDVYLKASSSFSQKDEAMTFVLAVQSTVQPAPSGSSGTTANTTGPVSGISGLIPNFLVDNLGSTSRSVVVSTQSISGSSYYIYTFIFSGTASSAHNWTGGTEQLIFSIQFNGCTSNCNPSSYLMVNLANGGSQGNSYWYFQPNTLGDITNYPAPFYASSQTIALVNGGSSDGTALSYVTLATPFTYYPKSSATDLSQTSNWTTDVNGGAGSPPSDFNTNNQLFNINNNVTNPIVGGAWSLSNGSNVVLNNTNGLVFSSVSRLNIGAGSNIDFNSKLVTLKSDATGTASIGTIIGTLSNATNVTAERYFTDRRAWRLLGIRFNSSTQTIKSSWMEGGTSSTSNPNPPYGTHITTFTADANAANFDAQKPASSIRIYSSDNFNSDAIHTPNTTNLITSNPAYFLFVRGNRSIDLTNSAAHSTAALRVTGTINMGNLTSGIAGTSFSLIPNPYPSPINFDSVKSIPANSGITTFYIYDATLAGANGVGQYRTITISGSAPAYTYTSTPGSQDNNWRFIESGAAFMVPGSTSVSFTENTKTSSTPTTSLFRTTSPAGTQPELAVNLNIVNADNSVSLADGVREIFDNSYAAGIDNDDAKKIQGFQMNFGIASNNQILSVEKRPVPNSNDIISLQLSDMAVGNYQFEVQPSNLSSAPQFIYLRDNYLNTYTPISATDNTTINFSITSDAASAGENRFSIVFSKASIAPGKSLITVYPNPVQGGSINLLLNNMPKGLYNVRLLNTLGQTILSKQINHAEGTSTETIRVNNVKGAYMIEVTKPDNTKFTNKIIIN